MRIFSFIGLILIVASNVLAQRIPKDEYIKYVPIKNPPLVRQAPGSAELMLYGNKNSSAYRDINPVDGIDDQRGEHLMKIAERFSPILIQNSFAAPLDFKKFTEHGASYLINVDEWNLAGAKAELMESYTIDILNLTRNKSKGSYSDTTRDEISDDKKLISLLHQFDPENPTEISYRKAAVESFFRSHKVLYIDFPGSDIESWKAEYLNPHTSDLKQEYRNFIKTFVHPFINKVESNTSGFLGYELVLQYYFFYPFNDGANNHIGDWEHLNVVVSPLSKVEELLNKDEIEQILNDNWQIKEDPLVIKRVESYFHHNVLVLDYSSPNVYKPRKIWEKEIEARPERRIDERKLWRKFRDLAYQDEKETIINTHPIAYIGGDSKGLDLLLVSPGGQNRDSHGTFPFPGLYKDVGPGGATEQISLHFNHYDYFKSNFPEKNEKYKRGGVITFDRPERLEILPDWERVIDLVYQSAEMRQKWYWMLLPLHWGYPAIESPLAGIVEHADTGNLSPYAPWYQGAWNRSGATKGHSLYEPHSYYLFMPLSITDSFQNNFGFLNVTTPLLVHLPPLDIAWTLLSSPIEAITKKENPVFYPAESVPYRFFSIMPGITKDYLPKEFFDLLANNKQGTKLIFQLSLYMGIFYSDSLQITDVNQNIENPVAFNLDATIQKGRVSLQNTIIYSRSDLNSIVKFNNDVPDFKYQTELNMWQYEGSLRINLSTNALQPYVRLGYGYTWYRLENTKINGVKSIEPKSDWFNKPFSSGHYLPNSFIGGIGAEWIFIKSVGKLPKGIDISFKLEYDWKWHKLGLDIADYNIDDLLEIGYLTRELPQNKTVMHKYLKGGIVFSF
jgi:hypothetical protein